jgi:predicted PP-loop superfamily ATPase
MSRELDKLSKDLQSIEIKQTKEFSDIKKVLKKMDQKLTQILEKIQEFEIIMDAAEMLEEHMEDRDEYNTEWNPYDDEDYEPEEYENYEDDEEN